MAQVVTLQDEVLQRVFGPSTWRRLLSLNGGCCSADQWAARQGSVGLCHEPAELETMWPGAYQVQPRWTSARLMQQQCIGCVGQTAALPVQQVPICQIEDRALDRLQEADLAGSVTLVPARVTEPAFRAMQARDNAMVIIADGAATVSRARGWAFGPSADAPQVPRALLGPCSCNSRLACWSSWQLHPAKLSQRHPS